MDTDSGQVWPPTEVAAVWQDMRGFAAWWSGDQEELRAVHGGGITPTPTRPGYDDKGNRVRSAQYAGGMVGSIARAVWGRPATSATTPRYSMHVPVAADIAQGSADILYAEPFEVSHEDERLTAELQKLFGPKTRQALQAGAETGSVFGGTFYRVVWDEVRGAFVTSVDADTVVPYFRWGQLVAADIVTEEDLGRGKIKRTIERHFLGNNGDGQIAYSQYLGDRDRLGDSVDPIIPGVQLDEYGAVEGLQQTPGLWLIHCANRPTSARWRTDQVGRHLGRSDLEGVEDLMAAVDEAYSSWCRDIRLAKGRVIIPEAMLTSLGPGAGNLWDSDQELYAPLTAPVDIERGLDLQIVQFDIRHAEHKATCDDWIRRTIQMAGYSPQTFGEVENVTGAITATEVRARERRTYNTTDKKAVIAAEAISLLAEKLLTISGERIKPGSVQVRWPDGVHDSPLALAQTLQSLDTAQAVSTYTKVRMLNPSWTEEDVKAEVDRIQDLTGLAGIDV